MVGRRALRVAVLAGALTSMLQMLPDQDLREQLLDVAAQIEVEAEGIASEVEFNDELLTLSGPRAA